MNIHRLATLLLVAACAAWVSCSGLPRRAPEGPSDRPNVLFIAVDDLRPTLGAYGDRDIKTPNIDRLARSGAVFLQAHVQQAVCNPSRASLMTGLRPDTLKVWDLETDFRTTTPDALTIPQHFRRHGYFAASIGKVYHNVLPDHASWSEPEMHVPGFPFDPDAVYRHPDNLAVQESRKAAFITSGLAAQHIDQYGLWYVKANATESVDAPDSVYYDGAQTDMAVAKLAELKARKEPFFFSVGYYRPHLPFNAPKRYWDLYDRDAIPMAANPFPPKDGPIVAMSTMRELKGYADFANAAHPFDGSLSEADARRLKHGYYASVSYIDAQVGRLLDQLDALDLARNTIVVLWGDHGYKLGEHNGWAKMTDYQIDTHAPLIVRAPGAIAPGTRVARMVEFVDIYPTLSELAGLPLPPSLEGVSAVPLLTAPDRPWKPAVFSQFLRAGTWAAPDGRAYMGYSLLTDRYHYVLWIDWVTKAEVARELYDRQVDPDENTNLAGRPEHAALLEGLEAQRRSGWIHALPQRP